MTLVLPRSTRPTVGESARTAVGAFGRRGRRRCADVFLTAWRRIEDVPDGEAALPWLYGVAFKVHGRQWRGRSRKQRLEEKLRTVGVDLVSEPEELLIASEESKQVMEALDKLKATDKEILLLAAWEGMAHADIAAALDINVGAVRQRFYKAKQNLTREYNRIGNQQVEQSAGQKGGAW